MCEALKKYLFETRALDVSVRLEKVVGGRSWVKVGKGGERWWCKVHGVRSDGAVLAHVDNILVGAHGFQHGDCLVLQPEHALEVADVTDMVNFQGLSRTLGVVQGARAWRQQRIVKGEGVESNGPLIVGW